MNTSMTQDGSPYDNAIAERVNGILKREWLEQEVFVNIEQVRGEGWRRSSRCTTAETALLYRAEHA